VKIHIYEISFAEESPQPKTLKVRQQLSAVIGNHSERVDHKREDCRDEMQ